MAKKPYKEKTLTKDGKNIGIKITTEQLDIINKYCKDHDIDKSKLILYALKEYINRHN